MYQGSFPASLLDSLSHGMSLTHSKIQLIHLGNSLLNQSNDTMMPKESLKTSQKQQYNFKNTKKSLFKKWDFADRPRSKSRQYRIKKKSDRQFPRFVVFRLFYNRLELYIIGRFLRKSADTGAGCLYGTSLYTHVQLFFCKCNRFQRPLLFINSSFSRDSEFQLHTS